MINNFVRFISDELSVGESTLTAVCQCFLTCMGDYTLDRRGDVGSLVHKAIFLFILLNLFLK